MNVRIEAVTNRKALMEFIRLPWRIYRGIPQWVPPLIMDQKTLLSRTRNPFFQHADVEYFLARRNGQAVGRIAAIVNRAYVEFQGEQVGFFGFLETVDDSAVAAALFDAAAEWLRARGMGIMRGPTNPSTNDTLGLLVDAFDSPPMVMMPYNPPYYPPIYEACGMIRSKDLYAYWLEEDMLRLERVGRLGDLVQRRHNVTIRRADMKRVGREVELIKGIYNDAWTRNWAFVPWTDAEFEHLGRELKPVAEPDLVLFAYKDGEPVGFALSLPDVHQALIKVRSGRLLPFGLPKLLWYSRKISQVRVMALGIRHRYRGMGIDAVLYHQTFRNATAHGMGRGECSWVLEDNAPMRNALEKMGARIYKTYRMYDRAL